MTRYLIKLISRLSLACGLIACLSVAIGYILPSAPEILFTASFDQRVLNIYRMNLSRHIIAAVTLNHGNNFLPAWSPDGQHIAYISDRNGNYTLYVTDAVGHNTRRLIQNDSNQYDPYWSPDGRQIAYVNEKGGYGEIMVYDTATGTSESVTDSYRTHVNPIWYPDGNSITFVSDLDQRWNTKIYTVDLKSRLITPIRVGSAVNPIWSPDGRYLLYTSGYEKPNLYIWDKTIQQFSLFYAGNFISNDTPAWSPDGRTVLISVLTTYDNSAIFQIPVEDCLKQESTCTPQLITAIPGYYINPHWKPQ